MVDGMTVGFAVILFAAAFVAGVINSVAGGGTLITFPALLLAGLDAKTANATSTVALWPGLLAGAAGYRHELAESRAYLARLALPSIAGGALGAWILIATPTPVFERLVPFLILFATVLFIAQEPISKRLRLSGEGNRPTVRWESAAMGLQFLSAVYGGYFGAGNGIIMLAVFGLIGLHDIHRANGLKTLLGAVLNSVAVAAFTFSGLVRWWEALIMAAGAIAGGYMSAHVARGVSPAVVRRLVIAIGFIIGATMLWRLRN
jgi:hypothetical protein